MTSKTREGPPWGPLPGKGRHGSGPFEIGLRVNDGPCPRWGLGTLADEKASSSTPFACPSLQRGVTFDDR